MAGDTHGFDKESARRIADVVRRVEFVMGELRSLRQQMQVLVNSQGREIFHFILTGTLSGSMPDRTATGNLRELGPDGTWYVMQTGVTLHDDFYGTLEGDSGATGTFVMRGNRRVILTLTCG